MRKLIDLSVVACLALALGACGERPTTPETPSPDQQTVGTEAGSLGKVTVDTEVSEWNVGTGQFNGEFVTAEGQGIELGLRAKERFVGPLDVTGADGNRVGVYEAPVGPSPRSAGDNNGTWNYDFHVDLSDATGRHAGRTVSDYRLVLEQDFTDQSLFGVLGSDPVVLPMGSESNGGVCSSDTFTQTLCQQSWNPGFGNSPGRELAGEGEAYDPNDERTYNLRLVLIPETFNAQPLAVAIRVDVSD